MLKLCVFFVIFFVEHSTWVHSYTIPPATNRSFPHQRPLPGSQRSFVRVNPSGLQTILSCPRHFRFSETEMKCVYHEGYDHKNDHHHHHHDSSSKNEVVCPSGFRGQLANPKNCSTFFNCWDGVGFQQSCDEFTCYNAEINGCDFPERAGCCEFLPKNPGVIVSKIFDVMSE